MKLKITFPCLAILFSLLLASCVDLKEPKAEFRGYDVLSLDVHKAKFNFNFDVYNPNNIALDNGSYDYTIKIDGADFIGGKDLKIGLKANDTTKAVIPVEIQYDKLFNTATALLNIVVSGKKEIPYEINGIMKFDVFSMTLKSPIKASGKLPLPKF